MYVKLVETAMFYYFLKFLNFPPPPAAAPPCVPTSQGQDTEAGCRHRPEEMAGDAAGDT
ncbi:unnamed protein product, partial [Staurois parvus]